MAYPFSYFTTMLGLNPKYILYLAMDVDSGDVTNIYSMFSDVKTFTGQMYVYSTISILIIIFYVAY